MPQAPPVPRRPPEVVEAKPATGADASRARLPVTPGLPSTERPPVDAPLRPSLPGRPKHVATDAAALAAFVANVKQLPLFSVTAMQLMKSVGQEDVKIGELVRLISTDAALVAHLLRIVNSPFYRLPQPCATVAEAVTVLGFSQVRRMVTASVSQRPLASHLSDTSVARAFWRHQMLCGAMARHLALASGLDGEMAYMAGLMHEVGRLAMLIQHPHLTDVLLRVEDVGARLGTQQEIAHFGFDHAHAGGALLAQWGLPPAIVRATREHGDDDMPEDALSAAVWRANLLAHDMVHENDEPDVEKPWMAAVGLTLAERRRMFDEIAALEHG